MRVKSVAFSVVALAVLVAGCAATPTQEQINAADYGPEVYQYEAQTAAKGFFSHYLKDPLSAEYKFEQVHRGYYTDSVLTGGHLHGGYMLQVSVNAKNAFGGYVGFRLYRFLIKDDKIVNVWRLEPSGSLHKIG
ncbi:hypothetical protein [Pseudomonas sp. dw_358]|uniref:hypothetical protein n=1 Tax=Pseudomonas sp. dw_358 TaxID=2720083 RepID=UPI001BD2EB62|nr:hypothetical protein [Pseudomonas sp. dw_358]